MTEKPTAPLRIMAFFAHPDDETMFLGGTLAYLAERGAEIHYLCATRGEGGEMGDPPVCTREDLGDVRESELACAVKALGGKTLQFLPYQDPVVGPDGELYPFSDDFDKLVEEVREKIFEINPQIILTHGPGGEYGHPAHIQTHQALIAALEDLNLVNLTVYAPSWLSRETGEFTPEPGIMVDVSSWIEQKIEAAMCHQSQHGLFIRHGSVRAGRPVTVSEVVRGTEALCRISPSGEISQDDPLFALLMEISLPGL
ncbi:MAG: PIG-L family deacetylase [Anaerolineales bacterium]|nr:PIG-L family deacetylase [Anaerolineales bacterium]